MFLQEEEVTLWVDLKNVPTLFVKIFEINTENYYRQTMSVFKTDVNLDGLIASEELIFEFKELPQKEFTKKFSFEGLKDKGGLYVIEFIGNGRSSRAVIKKGTLSIIHKPTIAGQVAYILDAHKKICKSESTGIWIDNSFFKADLEKNGRIIIPYTKNTHTSKGVLLHEGLAQLIDLQRTNENYQLKAAFVLLPESIIMGNKATIIIRPNLLINGRKADLNLLKEVKCTLATSNFIDDIPVTKVYDKLKINANNEILISFQVPAHLQLLALEFTAEVNNTTLQKKQTLTERKKFDIVTHQHENQICELFLRYMNDQYQLLLLGKNGEPKVNLTQNFNN